MNITSDKLKISVSCLLFIGASKHPKYSFGSSYEYEAQDETRLPPTSDDTDIRKYKLKIYKHLLQITQ